LREVEGKGGEKGREGKKRGTADAPSFTLLERLAGLSLARISAKDDQLRITTKEEKVDIRSGTLENGEGKGRKNCEGGKKVETRASFKGYLSSTSLYDGTRVNQDQKKRDPGHCGIAGHGRSYKRSDLKKKGKKETETITSSRRKTAAMRTERQRRKG